MALLQCCMHLALGSFPGATISEPVFSSCMTCVFASIQPGIKAQANDQNNVNPSGHDHGAMLPRLLRQRDICWLQRPTFVGLKYDRPSSRAQSKVVLSHEVQLPVPCVCINIFFRQVFRGAIQSTQHSHLQVSLARVLSGMWRRLQQAKPSIPKIGTRPCSKLSIIQTSSEVSEVSVPCLPCET